MPEGTADDLAVEAATNERYLAVLDRLPPVVMSPTSMSANTRWTGTGRTYVGELGTGPLAARIGLRKPDEDLGRAFYIGARRVRTGTFDAEVVSWDAPIAKVFYDPARCEHEIMADVVGRRSLFADGNAVVRVFDDWVDGKPPAESPFARAQLVVRSAPSTAGASRRARPSARPSATNGSPAEPQAVSDPRPTASVPTTASRRPSPTTVTAAAVKVREGMRASDSVDYALARPRSDALQSLLATIQPDQYELITARPDRPLLLQGHPGTGKSVIAIHRAAYLVSPGRAQAGPDESWAWPSSLLFVGPTTEWRQHVERAVHSLDERRAVMVMSIPQVLAQLAGIKLGTGGPDPSLDDAARFVHAVVSKAVKAARADGLLTASMPPVKAVETIYDVVRTGRSRSAWLDLTSADSRAWIKTLPLFERARQQMRYHGLFAAIGRLIFTGHPRFDHVIVDEAQDVTGLEWSLLATLNQTEDWTLVGDMNQRRNDYVDSSWEGIADRLYMGAVQPRILERGYRSTQPILDFAKALLKREERTALTLQQEGPAVSVTRATTGGGLGAAAIAQALRLRQAYPQGTVGIIAAVPEPVRDALASSGWRRQGESTWVKGDDTLRLLTHVTSRGVEFDGVVVVEPAAFPKNLGRSGPLYTSLTRANRELAVVHHTALPDALRRHARAS